MRCDVHACAYADAEGLCSIYSVIIGPTVRLLKLFVYSDDHAGCARRGTFVLDSAGMIRWQQINKINEPREIAAVLAATANL